MQDSGGNSWSKWSQLSNNPGRLGHTVQFFTVGTALSQGGSLSCVTTAPGSRRLEAHRHASNAERKCRLCPHAGKHQTICANSAPDSCSSWTALGKSIATVRLACFSNSANKAHPATRHGMDRLKKTTCVGQPAAAVPTLESYRTLYTTPAPSSDTSRDPSVSGSTSTGRPTEQAHESVRGW